jgi:hypothetical protein
MVKFLDPIGRQGGGGVKLPLSGRTQKITPSGPSMPPGVTAQLGSELSKIATRYIEERTREKDRAKMQEILMAYRKGTPGEKKIIDLPESEIIKQYGDPAAKTEYGWIDPDETEEDQAMRATDARELAMPELDDQGRRFTQEYLEGLAAARHVAGSGRLGQASEGMLNTLMMDTMKQARAKRLLGEEREHEREVAKALAKNKLEVAGKKTPSNIAEWNIYEDMSPEDQEKYLSMKRANPWLNLGGRVEKPSQIDPKKPLASRPVTLKPSETPGHAANVAQAAASGTAVGKDNLIQYNVAKTSYEQQRKNNDLINHLNKSDATTGLAAEFINNINRVKALFGDMVATGKVIATETLDVRMGSEVFLLIKSLGIGARGMDTPAEREFMRKVLTGQIQLNKGTLLRMAQMRFEEAGFKISNWNKRVDSGELDNFFKFTGVKKGHLEPFPTPGERAAIIKKFEDKYNIDPGVPK